MQSEPASDAPQSTIAKLPWETPLCLPLDTAQGTEKPFTQPMEVTNDLGPAS